jgi:death-on-curing protein
LSQAHAFVDGNKRVAAAITETFLETNGNRLNMTDDEVVKLFLDIASGVLDRHQVEQQLREKIEPKS